MATESAENPVRLVSRPPGARPRLPAGFKAELYTDSVKGPRLLRVAPNGDLFVAESVPGRVKVFRGVDRKGRPESGEIFAQGLDRPFGIAFYPPGSDPKFVYVAQASCVERIPYRNGDLKARAARQRLLTLPGGGHWTRDVAFSTDGAKMFVSVGSFSNNEDTDRNPREYRRADILSADPSGGDLKVHAWGLRNAVGLAVDPVTGALWASVNERDGLGDDLPPDYITRVAAGGFYGWPWFYIGGHQDPSHPDRHLELKDRVVAPDVLIQPHNASMQLVFYEGQAFPRRFQGGIFAAQHGSWNRSVRTGYEVVFVPVRDGRAQGWYEDFMSFITPEGWVWGRPVGVAVGRDGALFVSEDGSSTIWRVTWSG
jgi:glucose/arabinose dehydrogenase